MTVFAGDFNQLLKRVRGFLIANGYTASKFNRTRKPANANEVDLIAISNDQVEFQCSEVTTISDHLLLSAKISKVNLSRQRSF